MSSLLMAELPHPDKEIGKSGEKPAHWRPGEVMQFVTFRLAAILHGIKGRLARGNASSAHAAAMVGQLEPLADLALAQARTARLDA